MREFIIVAFTLVAIILLVIMWVWYIVFGKSLRKMIFMMLGVIQDRDRLVDPEKEIIPSLERHASDDLKDIAAHVKADIPLQAQQVPPQARVPQYERGELARDTSDNGWPREMGYEERHEPRPFLNANLQTETEIYEPPQDLVQRAAILDVENPIVQPPQAPIDVPMPPNVVQVEPPIVQPPQAPVPTTIPPSSPHVEPPAVQPPQPLIDVQPPQNMPQAVNPVVPPQAPIDVQMPPGEPPVAHPPQAPGVTPPTPDVPYANTSEEDLRSSSIPPGRMTRDKRYNRNESD